MSNAYFSIILVTFNSKEFISGCLSSVFAQGYRDFEVIIVDNGSSDGTVNFIKKEYPQLRLIENKENLGASRARNQAIGHISGPWVLTLDCDAILEKDFLEKLYLTTRNIPAGVFALQPKILKRDRKTVYSCGIYLSVFRRFYDIGKGAAGLKFDTPEYIFGACCACALYNSSLLKDLKEPNGYFDERFFFLVEDVDLSWRAQKRGYRAFYVPEAVCYHDGNSSRTSDKLRQYLCFRNRYLMIGKNESFPGKFRLAVFNSWYEIPRFLYMLFSNRFLQKNISHIFGSLRLD